MVKIRAAAFLSVYLGLIFFGSAASFGADTWAGLNRQVTDMYQKRYYTKAIPVAEKALSLAEKQYGPESPETALSLNNLGMLYKHKKMYSKAEPLYKRSLAISEKIVGSKSPDLTVALNNLAMLYAEMGKWSEARHYSIRAMSILEKHYGVNHAISKDARRRYLEMEKKYKK
jgi:tetratricopeptide (TPR) repeat protein